MVKKKHSSYYLEIPPPDRRHVFRDAKYARQTVPGGGMAALRAYVYSENEKEKENEQCGAINDCPEAGSENSDA